MAGVPHFFRVLRAGNLPFGPTVPVGFEIGGLRRVESNNFSNERGWIENAGSGFWFGCFNGGLCVGKSGKSRKN